MKITAAATTHLVLWSSLALALTVALWSPAQTPTAGAENAQPMTEEKMKGCCATMKTHIGKVKAEVKTQDDELTKHVAKMNSAPAEQKMEIMAAVVTHMAEDRIVLNEHTDILNIALRQHLMQHMSMSKESITGCSMMKGMEEKSADTQKESK